MSAKEVNPDYFRAVEVQKPSDQIINQIKGLISEGKLNPGDKLSPERVLAERFKVGRGHIREALKKLEFYGLVETRPNKGRYIARLGTSALEGILTNILELADTNFESLMELRAILEVFSARLAALRGDERDKKEILAQYDRYEEKMKEGGNPVEEDMLLHLKIARAAHNPVLESMISLLIPDTIRLSLEYADKEYRRGTGEHWSIVEAIRNDDPDAAFETMQTHMNNGFMRRFSGDLSRLLPKMRT